MSKVAPAPEQLPPAVYKTPTTEAVRSGTVDGAPRKGASAGSKSSEKKCCSFCCTRQCKMILAACCCLGTITAIVMIVIYFADSDSFGRGGTPVSNAAIQSGYNAAKLAWGAQLLSWRCEGGSGAVNVSTGVLIVQDATRAFAETKGGERAVMNSLRNLTNIKTFYGDMASIPGTGASMLGT
jgi:hypothetical protein